MVRVSRLGSLGWGRVRSLAGAASIFASAAFLLTALWAGSAAAQDRVLGLRSSDMQEVDHEVRVELQPGHARLVVQRTVFHTGERPDQASFDIELPPGAVAVGLRSRGIVNGKPRWFDGELLEAKEAARRYQELTGKGLARLKDPALLWWQEPGRLALQVFPCLPRERKTVEYTLLVPTKFTEGAHQWQVPSMGTAARKARLLLGPVPRGYQVLQHEQKLSPGDRIDDGAPLLLQELHSSVLSLRLGQAATGAERVVERFGVDVGTLGEIPKELDVVFVLDMSHSFGQERIARSLQAARSYLSFAPHAQVRLVGFHREAQPLDTQFRDGRSAAADFSALSPTPKNGSEVLDGLALAAKLLAARPPGRERRIVLLTDTLTRSTFSVAQLKGLAKHTSRGGSGSSAGVLLHIAQVNDYGPSSLSWAPQHPWNEAAEATGGLLWETSVHPDAADDEAQRAPFEEWVRPIRLHDFRVERTATVGASPETLVDGEVLAAGEGFEVARIVDGASARFAVSGRRWAEPVQRVAFASEQQTRLAAALVFGTDDYQELTDAEMMTVARRGGAVSPVTSYLAIEPGVRPSTEGIERGQVGIGRGFGSGSGRLKASAPGFFSTFDPQAYLEGMLLRLWGLCGGSGRARVELETTFDEIVRVDGVSVQGSQELARICLEEALWEEKLPGARGKFDERFAAYQVEIE